VTLEAIHHSTEDARFSVEYMTEMILRFATSSEFHMSQGSCIFADAKSPGEHEFKCGNLGHGQWAASISRIHSYDDKPTVATIVVKDVSW
jgi:hypothetical protein